jgi:hypothetical protein
MATNNSNPLDIIFTGNVTNAQGASGIATKAFVLNLSVGVGLFVFQICGFLLLKSSGVGRYVHVLQG